MLVFEVNGTPDGLLPPLLPWCPPQRHGFVPAGHGAGAHGHGHGIAVPGVDWSGGEFVTICVEGRDACV